MPGSVAVVRFHVQVLEEIPRNIVGVLLEVFDAGDLYVHVNIETSLSERGADVRI